MIGCAKGVHDAPVDALAVAEALLMEKGRSFYWARSLLGEKYAARATRLYCLCRHLDDLADEALTVEGARASLDSASRDISAGASVDPIICDGLALMEECGIEKDLVLQLIKGAVSDLGDVLIDDEGELLRYCYRVAGTVGLMMCHALDLDDTAAFPHAIDLGIAMQLTNICRDVREDAVMGRRYLPSSSLGKMQPAQLIDPAVQDRGMIQQEILRLLALADTYYRSGEAGLAYLPLQSRTGILVAARVYHAIGKDLRSRGGDCWSRRAVVSSLEKAVITTRALATLPANRSFWNRSKSHQAALHASLTGMPHVAPSSEAK
jgi:phytoene synthase